MPKVSVVIASYNHEKYVAEAIQSILDQTYQDFEIVITDDGSTDGTVAEIKKSIDPRIKLFCFENNRGACVAMRKCLDEAKEEYVAVLNSDDIFLPSKLEKQVQFLDEHPELGAVFGYAQIVDENGDDFTDTTHPYYDIFNRSNRTRFEWLNHFFYKGNCLCHPSVLIRNECYKSIGYYDERYAQLPDFDFWVRLCMKYEIYIMPENLIKFRVRSDEANISGARLESIIRHNWEYTNILKHYLKINSVDILLRVFPEAKEYENIDSDSIPFILAMLALKIGDKVHQDFALDVVANQLSNREIAKKLVAKFGFKYIDFIDLTGRCDLYGIENARSGLEAVRNELEAIYNPHGWKLLNYYYKFRNRIFPMGTLRRKAAKAFHQLFFDWNRFKQNVKRGFYLRKQDNPGAMSLKVLDLYVSKEPKNQNILDIFANEWSSATPDDSGLVTKPGKSRLFEDDRIKWLEEILGGFHSLDILELGPLEGGHSYMLQRMGAKKITSIEANTRAFLKCLCIKEIFDLNRVEYKLGDFVSFLKETDVTFDLVIACGVLYHMMNPIELLELISQVTDRIFIWTHYYDKEIITSNKKLSPKFGPLKTFEYRGDTYLAAKQSYEKALDWSGFCGGSKPTSKWLCRDSIINYLQKLNFSKITIGFDDPSHPNGPAFAIYAKR